MKKILTLILSGLLLLSGCSRNIAQPLNEENITPVQAQQATEITQSEQTEQVAPSADNEASDDMSTADKMATIGFEDISGYYTRTALEDEAEYIEMFAFDKNTFVRIATNDLEREVFAYDYLSDDFTYIYYFDGEMTAKTEINIATGAVYEDEGGYADLLTATAEEIKIYFGDLMEAAGLSPDELH